MIVSRETIISYAGASFISAQTIGDLDGVPAFLG